MPMLPICPVDVSGIEAVGGDEVQWRSGRTHLGLVSQITGCKRLLRVSHGRTERNLRGATRRDFKFHGAATGRIAEWLSRVSPSTTVDSDGDRR